MSIKTCSPVDALQWRHARLSKRPQTHFASHCHLPCRLLSELHIPDAQTPEEQRAIERGVWAGVRRRAKGPVTAAARTEESLLGRRGGAWGREEERGLRGQSLYLVIICVTRGLVCCNKRGALPGCSVVAARGSSVLSTNDRVSPGSSQNKVLNITFIGIDGLNKRQGGFRCVTERASGSV